jgi:glutaredoxin
MIVRIISSKNCSKCKGYLSRLDKQGFKYQVYDSDDPANKKQLDEWRITDLPVIQIVDDGGNVAYPFPAGTYSTRFINAKIDELKERRNEQN